MGETLSEKTYGLTHEDKIIAHHLLVNTTKKTPYQLDLEIKNRKPDIVPKVGDKVKIKSREWYEKWKNACGNVSFPETECIFSAEMQTKCGKVFTVHVINNTPWGKRWILGPTEFYFIPEMFEEVYQKQPQIEAVSFYPSAIADVSAATAVGYTYPSSPQGIGIAADWNKIIKDASERITVPCNLPSHAYAQAELERVRSLWGLKKEPELQMIKKRRFIKLEKL